MYGDIAEMAELSRMKKRRSANKNVIKGLILKARDRMVEGYDKLIIDEVNAFIKTMKAKEKLIEASKRRNSRFNR